MYKYSYVVDVGLSAFKPPRFNNKNESGQELFCRCGGRLKYQQKIMRDVLIINRPVYQEDYDMESITCPYCNETYNSENKIHILEPEVGTLMEVNFFYKKQKLSNGGVIHRLIKQRFYAFYSDKKENLKNLKESMVYDEISYDETTGELSFFVDNSKFKDNYTGIILKNILDSEKDTLSELFLEQNLNTQITFASFDKIKQFFNHNPEIEYNNLESCFDFLKIISDKLIDFQKFKENNKIYLSTFCEEYKIHLEKIQKQNNTTQYKRFRYVEDEFSFQNEKVKIEFNPGSYLDSLHDMAVIIFAIQIFPNIITIYQTKDYRFFSSLIKSPVIVNPNVFKYHQATYPTKIIEVIANYNPHGDIKKASQTIPETEGDGFLQISNLIYKKITNVKDINKLKTFYEKNYLNKLQLEQLFQKYSAKDLYTVFGFLGDSDKKSILEFRHIEHIIRYKPYLQIGNDFLNVYCDTVKSLRDIVKTQPAVIKHINSQKNISEKEKQSLSVYLTIKETDIFEIKNGKDLKKLHDNLSILYSVFQDATKVERYALAIEKFEDLNTDIDFYTFEVIPSAFELQREHKIMKHCINTYIDGIISGNYLAVRVVDKISNEHSTLGLHINNKIIKFDQLKSYQNSVSSPYLISAVLKFFNLMKIDANSGAHWDLKPDGKTGMRDSRKEVLPLDECQGFRNKLLAIQKTESKKKEKERMKPEDYMEKILEFQEEINSKLKQTN